jgi:hypothetical protein
LAAPPVNLPRFANRRAAQAHGAWRFALRLSIRKQRRRANGSSPAVVLGVTSSDLRSQIREVGDSRRFLCVEVNLVALDAITEFPQDIEDNDYRATVVERLKALLHHFF